MASYNAHNGACIILHLKCCCGIVLLVYQARPISLTHWKLCSQYGKVGEGLADVISMHEVLTNQILLRDFS